MSGPITLRVITPERVVLDTTVESVTFPALDGSLGVLKGHAPLVAALGVGELGFRDGAGQESGLFIAGGFAEVRDDTVRVVTEASEPPTAIDLARAEASAVRARKRLEEFQSVQGESLDLVRAQFALQRALSRVRVASKYRS
ncbi:MAG: ATP synthase F1 subunit epsilon [Planctomycetota bacterium]